MNKTVEQLAATARPKKKKRISVNKLVMDWMRAKGWTIGIVEQRIPKTFITRDFLGFIDMIACNGNRVIGLQVTSRGHVQDRVKKSVLSEDFSAFASAAGFYVIGVDIADGQPRFRIIQCEPGESGPVMVEINEIPTGTIKFSTASYTDEITKMPEQSEHRLHCGI